VLEHGGDPHAWRDGRIVICRAARGCAECGVQFFVLPDEHLDGETRRLDGRNGILDGPQCGACVRAYFAAPYEFAMNGANGKAAGRAGGPDRAMGVRLIHKSSRGRKVHRVVRAPPPEGVEQEPRDGPTLRQRRGRRRSQSGPHPGAGREPSRSTTIHDCIFWLERVLLACERAQLKAWRDGIAGRGEERHTRIVHDDVVLGVIWETSADRRITALNCAFGADIASD
jgi:hypothetical protein